MAFVVFRVRSARSPAAILKHETLRGQGPFFAREIQTCLYGGLHSPQSSERLCFPARVGIWSDYLEIMPSQAPLPPYPLSPSLSCLSPSIPWLYPCSILEGPKMAVQLTNRAKVVRTASTNRETERQRQRQGEMLLDKLNRKLVELLVLKLAICYL